MHHMLIMPCGTSLVFNDMVHCLTVKHIAHIPFSVGHADFLVYNKILQNHYVFIAYNFRVLHMREYLIITRDNFC